MSNPVKLILEFESVEAAVEFDKNSTFPSTPAEYYLEASDENKQKFYELRENKTE
ncbi:hypothetical protein HNP93_001007 [Methanococcus maripaludis]|uniref:Uncharacterized protein n=1 Tax=Methanococcus maripaludis TaxID=39152 RepID=A0A7J9P6K1_METMI|nr:hypothetical protein [Methanococcus maripaludis]MBA2858306.1 hypothetical protein [Methanococcus maripaludis]